MGGGGGGGGVTGHVRLVLGDAPPVLRGRHAGFRGAGRGDGVGNEAPPQGGPLDPLRCHGRVRGGGATGRVHGAGPDQVRSQCVP